ncbi:hypothetical protein L6164_023680 [Bauhinia variegata]|uniref:Uncharacterized protein n=1 Tax=Bauhinia variegata TaxID=167791 RepID=A0ACB9MIY4_BAUVA|nr:hypothetical protein L6164_023680 [Bauhinia variegata]
MTGSRSNERSRIEREETQKRLEQLRRNVEEDDVVGLDNVTQVLLKQLVGGSEELQVVSITGMGGSGKTTLAKKIYNHSRVKNHFQCCVWHHVSNQQEEVEMEIRTSSDLSKEGNSGVNLDNFYSEFLKEKRFFIVIDGLWSPNILNEIRNAVCDDSNGSRILITTRIEEVGLRAGISSNSMPLLDMEQSWELFTRKVFQGEKFPPELEGLGREIVKRCCGLPTVVSVVGALAACSEKTIGMWLKLAEDIEWYLTHDKTDVLDVLALSYNNLSFTYKQCFLYLGVFPKDFEIPVRQLIQMWIAEGFFHHKHVAEDNLERLVDQSLVTVSSRRTDGGIKTCRIHNLNRLLCLSECKNNKFLELRTDTRIFSTSKPRRLSLHCETPLYICSNPPDDSSVHSLFCFGAHTYPFDRSDWDWLYKSFSLIRVLNLGKVKIEAIPDSIEKLILLKYLKVESEDLKVIPPSIGNILNLQTIDLRYSFINLLPAEIWKLRDLQHVYVSRPAILSNLHSMDSFQRLDDLQSLSTVALDKNTVQLFEKDMFHNISKLGLWYKPK